MLVRVKITFALELRKQNVPLRTSLAVSSVSRAYLYNLSRAYNPPNPHKNWISSQDQSCIICIILVGLYYLSRAVLAQQSCIICIILVRLYYLFSTSVSYRLQGQSFNQVCSHSEHLLQGEISSIITMRSPQDKVEADVQNEDKLG